MRKIILSLFIFLILPLKGYASDVSLEVTDFLVDAYILESGDMRVRELIVADGTFNWYERDLVYANSKLAESTSFDNNSLYNASDITDVVIKAKNISDVSFKTFNDTDYDIFIEDFSANNGDKAKYTLTNISNGYRYRTYYYTNNDATAFLIEYTVKDVVVLHEDVAEVYWTFVPDGFEESLNNIEIKLHLPASDTTDNFRIWAHGNLSGEVSFIDNTGVYAYIKEVLPGETVDIRTTFDKSLVNESLVVKKSNMEALNRIIEVETERADIANNLRDKLLFIYNFVKYGSISLYIAMAVLAIFIYFKYGKSPKSSYFAKYNREFIDDYNVEVIDYLMNEKITPNAMSASIMNLVYKKNISLEEIVSDKKKKEYKFRLENTDNINESENLLINFLFDKVGKNTLNEENKKVFTTIELKKYAKGTKTCDTFINSYTTWKNNVLKIAKSLNFYESNKVPKIIGVVMVLLVIIVFIVALSNEVDYIPAYFLIIAIVIFFIYCVTVNKRTSMGAEHYDKWKAFKNFLDDFGSFELKELPEIVLWERYLVYATIFGLADKVSKNMNVRINELETAGLDYDYYPSFVYYNLGASINSSINSAINSAYSQQAANHANSHSSSSSGSGFGGGFSSGGGFGGGGGGGRFG